MKKREFLKNLGLFTIATPILPMYNELENDIPVQKPLKVKGEKDFWRNIRLDYTLKKEYINLENGWYNFIPNPTLEKFMAHVKRINIEASYYFRTVQYDVKKRIASRVAGLVGCSSDELILTRNTTESLDTIISGYPWKKGDEAIMAEQEYGSMLKMFDLVSKRYGVKKKMISIPLLPNSDEEIVRLYEGQISPKTRIILASHMINTTGQILPIKKIVEMAHEYGVEVLVDGAHCVGHIGIDIADLNCDYYASSLHKWLSAPLGVGMLYVKRNKISKIWPLFGSYVTDIHDISRLNHTGTHPVHTDLAVDDAIDYFEMLGPKRKEKRLKFLQTYWIDQVKDIENIIINTPIEEKRSCAIANVGITGIHPHDLAKKLFNEYSIFTVAIDYSGVRGCRITPNVFNTEQELDVLSKALIDISKK